MLMKITKLKISTAKLLFYHPLTAGHGSSKWYFHIHSQDGATKLYYTASIVSVCLPSSQIYITLGYSGVYFTPHLFTGSLNKSLIHSFSKITTLSLNRSAFE